MLALRFCAWGAFALAAFVGAVGLANEAVMMITAAISAAVSGVLFLALDRIIELLDAIRSAVSGPNEEAVASETTQMQPTPPTRSIGELSSDIEKMKAKVNASAK